MQNSCTRRRDPGNSNPIPQREDAERGGRSRSCRLVRGRRQLVVVGLRADEVSELSAATIQVASLELAPTLSAPLRLVASIVLAEIARQVGRRRRGPPGIPARPPKFAAAVKLRSPEDVLFVEPSRLLAY